MLLNIGDMATRKIPPKLRLSTALARLPVRVFKVRERRQYKIITEYGRLKGLREHKELNPVKKGMAKSMGAKIACIQHPPKAEIDFSAAVSLYTGGCTISGAQKAGGKRCATTSEAPEAKPILRVTNLTQTSTAPR